MKLVITLGAAAVAALVAGDVCATTQRTFVAAGGNDANPCSLTAPCRSFAAAIVQTTTGGDVVVLDSAGYGAVVVTKSVAITAPAGVFAGVTVFSGPGIDVSSAGLRVVLRGLTITGIGGNVGVHVGAASDVTIERCDIATMLDYGIRADAAGATLHVVDTSVRASAVGISATGTAQLSLLRVRAESNAGDGIQVFNGAIADVRDSVASRNGAGLNVTSAVGFAVFTKATVDGFDASQNSNHGAWVYTVNGNIAHLSASRSVFTANGGHAVLVESTAAGDHSLASIADNQFVHNADAITTLTGSGGTSVIALARNTFVENGSAVNAAPSTLFLSAGGNFAELDSVSPAPPPAGSF